MSMIVRIIFLFVFFNLNYGFAKDIPIIVISAGKTPQSKSTVGSDVTVIENKDIEKWWFSKKVQESLKLFRNNICRFSANPEEELKNIINEAS